MNLIQTGFRDLDEVLGGGIPLSSVIILGSRPAMGKTSFLISLYERMVKKYHKEEFNFEFVSLENNKRSISLNRQSDVNFENFLFTSRSEGDIEENILDNLKFHKVNIIFIDSLQMIHVNDSNYSNFLRKIKSLSVLHNCIFFISSQLNRKVEERPGHFPILTDLKGFGEIEEFADQVWMLVRREYYDPNDKPGLAQIGLVKNNYGPNGRANFCFQREIMNFTDYAPCVYEPTCESESEFDRFSP